MAILANTSSLAVLVLKAKYFSDRSFLEAVKKPACSYLWSSIIWGREAFEKGTGWKVVDGKSLRVFHDRWIPCPSSFWVITVPSVRERSVCIAYLIEEETRQWDIAKIRDMC